MSLPNQPFILIDKASLKLNRERINEASSVPELKQGTQADLTLTRPRERLKQLGCGFT